MYGRRRRPLLGAAVIVGASRSVARHEVAQQTQAQAQRDQEIRYAEDQKRREQEETSRRTQLATGVQINKQISKLANRMLVKSNKLTHFCYQTNQS